MPENGRKDFVHKRGHLCQKIPNVFLDKYYKCILSHCILLSNLMY